MDKRDTIIVNGQTPFNKGLKNDDSYMKINMNNNACIDEIDLMIKVENNIIADILFDGEACMIVMASTSILIKTLIGKTVEEAKNIISNYENMINQEEYNKEIIGELIVFDEIYKQPSRKLCSLMASTGIKKLLK